MFDLFVIVLHPLLGDRTIVRLDAIKARAVVTEGLELVAIDKGRWESATGEELRSLLPSLKPGVAERRRSSVRRTDPFWISSREKRVLDGVLGCKI